jgi:hypothetical protein
VLVVSVFGIDMLDVSVFMAVSAGAVVRGVVVWTVSLFTEAESPRSGAAPVSSARLWQAAKVAAAARIQRVFMISPSGDRCPARLGRRRRGSSAAGLPY